MKHAMGLKKVTQSELRSSTLNTINIRNKNICKKKMNLMSARRSGKQAQVKIPDDKTSSFLTRDVIKHSLCKDESMKVGFYFN